MGRKLRASERTVQDLEHRLCETEASEREVQQVLELQVSEHRHLQRRLREVEQQLEQERRQNLAHADLQKRLNKVTQQLAQERRQNEQVAEEGAEARRATEELAEVRRALIDSNMAQQRLFIKLSFVDSLTNVYFLKKLRFEVLQVRLLDRFEELEEKFARFQANLPPDMEPGQRNVRLVYHTASEQSVNQIAQFGLRPSQCPMCLGTQICTDHDAGFFGNHTQGVYLSKHADYTSYYSKMRSPSAGDTGSTVVLKLVLGFTRHFDVMPGAVAPSGGYNCHESPNFLEYFVFDEETRATPPRPTYRAIPVALITWRVIASRAGIEHEV